MQASDGLGRKRLKALRLAHHRRQEIELSQENDFAVDFLSHVNFLFLLLHYLRAAASLIRPCLSFALWLTGSVDDLRGRSAEPVARKGKGIGGDGRKAWTGSLNPASSSAEAGPLLVRRDR